MRAFPVAMPSGSRYWTVVDEEFIPVPVADRWLLHLRFGRSRAELTTKAYAEAVALFLVWCRRTSRDWRFAAADLGLFIVWLTHTPSGPPGQVVAGPGSAPVRHERQINKVLTAVRGLLTFAVSAGEAPSAVIGQLYEVAAASDLPAAARGEGTGLQWRLGVQHRLQEPENPVDRASDEEIVALFRACRNARDRLVVLLLGRAGLRRGQAAGLLRQDCHLLADARALGCCEQGAHLHVVRRQNVNGAWSKSRAECVVPVDFLVVQAFDQYADERHARLGTGGSEFLLVNLYREPAGAPMPPHAFNGLLSELTRRAGLDRMVTPHMLRHAMASNVADAGAALDELQALLSHRSPYSCEPYLHPSRDRLRDAVARVPSPRELTSQVSR
jgi:integrase/recombinase XerD